MIIQTASIGDVILATPVVEKIRHGYPGAAIDFLTRKGNESLFIDHPHIRKVIAWDKSSKKYNNLSRIISEVRKTRYDCVINLQRFVSTGLITGFSGAGRRIGFNKNPLSFLFTEKVKHVINKEPGIHETDRNLLLTENLEGEGTFTVKLYPSEKNFRDVEGFKSQKYLCLAPASIWFTKQYPESKWIEFINQIDKNLKIYLLGSKNDFELCERIRNSCNHTGIENLAGKLGLLETAALMKGAAMNFVNDSAPQHLASSVNAPVTAIFCSTVPEFGFGPLSEDSAIIQTDRKLECRPCGLHGFMKCPEGHFDCATTININSLINRIPE